MNVSDQLVDALARSGVKRFYAITGDSLNPVNDAIRRDGRLQWVHVRHEESGAFAAAAEALLTGTLACCAGSSGPGHVHLINGLYDAQRGYAPVLAIASTMPSGEFGTQYFQSTEPLRLFADCSHYTQVATTAAQFPRMLHEAMQAAVSQQGVAVIGLPGDVAAMPAVESASADATFTPRGAQVPSDAEVQQLADLLNTHDAVALYCGMGCAGAHDSVARLAALLNATVTTTAKAKMKMAWDMPGYVGLNGLCGNQAGYSSLWEAEVMLLLGCDYPYDGSLPKGNIIAQVDSRATHLGRRARVQLGICGDVKQTLDKLLPLVRRKEKRDFLDKMLAQYAVDCQVHGKNAATPGSAGKIMPQFAMKAIDKVAAEDAVFTVDTGDNVVWVSQLLTANGKREAIGSYSHGSMANAMPMAIGAAFAAPGRQVVALCGDGGLSMLLGDLATIVQYKLPIKLVVFDNHALGFVKLEMEMDKIPDWQTDLYNPDFAAVARAMGMKGYDVSDPSQLEATLQEAFAADGPALVSVATDSSAVPAWPDFSRR